MRRPSGFRARCFARAAAVAGVIVLGACATGGGKKKSAAGDEDERASSADIEDPDHAGSVTTKRGEVLPSVSFGDGVEANWKLGEEAFADEDYLAAQRYYSYIRSKYPYSQYAALSDLRIGDCQYARGRFIEAIDSYQNFVRLHPTHDKVAYATYRVGLSHYQQIPGDWFLMPPSEEKEQTAARDAERALKDYVARFQNDESVADGKKVLLEVRKRLLAHERYVASFYQRLGKDRAYAGRLEVMRKDFRDVALDDALLAELVGAWARAGDVERARDALSELEKLYPGSPRVAEARARVAAARSASPALGPTRTATAGAAADRAASTAG